MIQTEVLEEAIKCVLLSSNIANTKPLSAMVIAKFEAGKTSLVRKYGMMTEGCFHTTDVTAFGIIRDTDSLRDFEEGKVSHLVIPDLLAPLSRKQSTVNTFLSFLNALIEEGVVDISTFATKIRAQDKRKTRVNAGLLTAIPKEKFFDKRHKFTTYGFLSRLMPITYSYSFSTQQEIFDYIDKQEFNDENLVSLPKNEHKVDVKLTPELSKELRPYVQRLADSTTSYGFRYLKQFQIVLKVLAYMREDTEVTKEDFDKFKEIYRFINLEFNEV